MVNHTWRAITIEMIRALWLHPYRACLQHLASWSRENPLLPDAFYVALEDTECVYIYLQYLDWGLVDVGGRLFPGLYSLVPLRTAQRVIARCGFQQHDNTPGHMMTQWKKLARDDQTFPSLYTLVDKYVVRGSAICVIFGDIVRVWSDGNRDECIFWLMFMANNYGGNIHEYLRGIRPKLFEVIMTKVYGITPPWQYEHIAGLPQWQVDFLDKLYRFFNPGNATSRVTWEELRTYRRHHSDPPLRDDICEELERVFAEGETE
jgi:hypothetical protein